MRLKYFINPIHSRLIDILWTILFRINFCNIISLLQNAVPYHLGIQCKIIQRQTCGIHQLFAIFRYLECKIRILYAFIRFHLQNLLWQLKSYLENAQNSVGLYILFNALSKKFCIRNIRVLKNILSYIYTFVLKINF